MALPSPQLPLFPSREAELVPTEVQLAAVNESAAGKQESTKALGAFYTDSQVADFLVRWAVRNESDTVLDPAFGGGVFLRAASKRLRELGGDPAAQVFGVELDAQCIRGSPANSTKMVWTLPTLSNRLLRNWSGSAEARGCGSG